MNKSVGIVQQDYWSTDDGGDNLTRQIRIQHGTIEGSCYWLQGNDWGYIWGMRIYASDVYNIDNTYKAGGRIVTNGAPFTLDTPVVFTGAIYPDGYTYGANSPTGQTTSSTISGITLTFKKGILTEVSGSQTGWSGTVNGPDGTYNVSNGLITSFTPAT